MFYLRRLERAIAEGLSPWRLVLFCLQTFNVQPRKVCYHGDVYCFVLQTFNVQLRKVADGLADDTEMLRLNDSGAFPVILVANRSFHIEFTADPLQVKLHSHYTEANVKKNCCERNVKAKSSFELYRHSLRYFHTQQERKFYCMFLFYSLIFFAVAW